MLRPKKTSFKKYQKGSFRRYENSISLLAKYKEGTVVMKSLQFGRLTAMQLQTCNQYISTKIKRLAKFQFKIFPDISVTKKPKEVRMGKGKGTVEFWACKVRFGSTLFEVNGVKKENAYSIFQSVSFKLPIKVKIIG
jgi:large subunit ribosomal protein L16